MIQDQGKCAANVHPFILTNINLNNTENESLVQTASNTV